MRRPMPARGFTLFELAAALVLAALLASLALPRLAGLRDRFAVWSARERVVAALSRARAEAPLRAGASVELRESPLSVLLVAGADTLLRLDADDLAGVRMVVSGSGPTATLRYDALGLGRVASRSVTFTRGDARAGVVVSAYGRVRRK